MDEKERLSEVIVRLRDRLRDARGKMFLSQSKQEAYYDGKASAFAEAIELVEESESGAGAMNPAKKIGGKKEK